MKREAAAIALAAAACGVRGRAPTPMLVAGAELVYESGGTVTTWRVEEAREDVAHAGMSGCLRVRYAPGGPSRGADERLTCARGDTLFTWDSAGSRWRAARPIGPGRSLDVPGREGSSIRYTTAAAAVDTIGMHRVMVIATTIVTTDSSGRAVRRLTERYAPALGTATRGTFEVADPASAGGWRSVREFRLVEIRPGTSRNDLIMSLNSSPGWT